jgi:uncharacterized tellurite resistance protein B-like protein
MTWQGKAIGAAVGSVLGPVGTVVGAWVGHAYDQHTQDQAHEEFYRGWAIFSLGVCAAYANGSLHPNERKRLLQFGRVIFGEIPEAQLDGYITQIGSHPITVQQCAEIFGFISVEFRPQVVCEILSILYADSKLEESEATWMHQLIRLSGSDPGLWCEVAAYFERESGAQADRNRCLQMLELPPEADQQTIKRAYHQQAILYHPDKLANVPEPLRKLAENKLREVNLAYEALTRPVSFQSDRSGLVVQLSPGQWEGADQLPGGSAAMCAICGQRNRLPEAQAMLRARCGTCYALLLLPPWLAQSQQPATT